MRATQNQHGTSIWLSAKNTEDWAERPGARWPCSTLSGHRIFAAFAPNGDLVRVCVDGGRGNQDCSIDEFNAIMSDHLAKRFGTEHPAIRGIPQ